MAIKNTYSEIKMPKLFSQIEQTLIQGGARQIMTDYGQNGERTSLSFSIEVNGRLLPVRLPANVENALRVLEREKRVRVTREHAYRVAWRNIADWLEAQMALIAIAQATIDQVFLPYVVMPSGQTVYEIMQHNQFALPEGRS